MFCEHHSTDIPQAASDSDEWNRHDRSVCHHLYNAIFDFLSKAIAR
jgi:hypothetical protein